MSVENAFAVAVVILALGTVLVAVVCVSLHGKKGQAAPDLLGRLLGTPTRKTRPNRKFP